MNPQPPACKSGALPSELPGGQFCLKFIPTHYSELTVLHTPAPVEIRPQISETYCYKYPPQHIPSRHYLHLGQIPSSRFSTQNIFPPIIFPPQTFSLPLFFHPGHIPSCPFSTPYISHPVCTFMSYVLQKVRLNILLI